MNKSYKLILSCGFVLMLTSCLTSRTINTVDTTLFPDFVPSNICHLKTTRRVRLIRYPLSYNSAGSLFEGQYLITAGHNLYDSFGTKLQQVKVSCRTSSGEVKTSTLKRKDIERTRKIDRYSENGNSFSYDYAFLKLNEPLEVNESINLVKDLDISKIATVEVAGYPGGKLKYGKGAIKLPIPIDKTFYYDVETAQGMSGGPVWGRCADANCLLGVHVSGSRARVVNKDLLVEYELWKKQLLQ